MVMRDEEESSEPRVLRVSTCYYHTFKHVHGSEAKDNAAYRHGGMAKDNAAYCRGGMADKDVG